MALRAPRAHPAALLFCATVLLQGCAGLQSQMLKTTERTTTERQKIEGLSYHLPMRYFVLKVWRSKGATEKAEWSESSLIADTRSTYVLNYYPHLIGKTDIRIDVKASGLLTTATTKTTDSAAELAKVVETKSLVMSGSFRDKDKSKDDCPADGELVFLFEGKEDPDKICGDVQYGITPVSAKGSASDGHFVDADVSLSTAPGVFYRQQRPYIAHVRVEGKVNTTTILSAPNESLVKLLPYARTLFAANDGQITLEDGMPTTYVQSTDGEFVAMLKVPAAVLAAYFNAIGQVFDAFSAKVAKEQELAVKQYKLALLAYKLQRCKEALEKQDSDAMKTLQCDELPATVD